MNSKKIRIAVMTDVHGNLPALKAALKAINERECDFIYNLGDTIAIGPFSCECLDLMLETKNLKMLMGNHEENCVFGIPDPRPDHISDGEVEHEKWVRGSLNQSQKDVIKKMPYIIKEEYFSTSITFLHYALEKGKMKFKAICAEPTPGELDALFEDVDSDIVFYGHNHRFSDLKGKRRYINPGSLGCSEDSYARFTIVECSGDGFRIEHLSAAYDKETVFEALENRKVPEREFISKAFLGKKL